MRFAGSTVGVCAAVMLLITGCASDDPGQGASAALVGQRFGSVGAWTAVPEAPLTARHEADGVWVAGRFVVFGGRSSPICPPNADCRGPAEPALRDGASFDPATGRWARIADAPVPLEGLNSVAAGDRLYLLAGEPGRADEVGQAENPLTFLSYAPKQDTWTTHPLPPMPGTLVAAGPSVVVVPGSDEGKQAIDAIFDVITNSWQQLPDDPLGPSSSRSATWVDGSLLLAAKDFESTSAAQPSLVRLARLDGTWSTLPDSEIIGYEPVAVGTRAVWPYAGSADGGKVNGWGRSYDEGGIFDSSTKQWKKLPSRPFEATTDCCNGVVIGDQVMVNSQLLNPATGRWTRIPPLPGTERLSATIVGSPDALLVWAGATMRAGQSGRPENLSTGYLLRPPVTRRSRP
jgi:hypothetical protein